MAATAAAGGTGEGWRRRNKSSRLPFLPFLLSLFTFLSALLASEATAAAPMGVAGVVGKSTAGPSPIGFPSFSILLLARYSSK
jgi:hypothetical protein